MKRRHNRAAREVTRANLIEYGLIVILIGIGIIAAATALGSAVSGGL